jgi:hypothetical protein
VSRLAEVILFPQHALALIEASVADIRGFAESDAKLLLVSVAQIVAKIARRTAFDAVGFVPAQLPHFAGSAPYAPIVDAVRRVLVALQGVGTDLTRDCRCAFVEFRSCLLYGNSVSRPLFDFQAFGVGQVLVLGHVGFSFSKCVRKAQYHFATEKEILPHKMQPL